MERIASSILDVTAQSSPLTANATWLKEYIDPVENFPREGVRYEWYGALFKDPSAFRRVISCFADRYRNQGLDAIAALDARGFLFGSALAYELSLPQILIRKPGKLPGTLYSTTYTMEYGEGALEVEASHVRPGQRVLIVDDLIATGGTAKASCNLIEQGGATVVEVACLFEISKLDGRQNLPQYQVHSLLAL